MKIKSDNTPKESEDILGRYSLAKEIGNALLLYSKKQKDGLTLSITGEWGSGKSTLLHFIKNYLNDRDDNPFTIIDFNPWMFYKNESIKEAFLIHLALSLKGLDSRTTHISNKVNDLLKAFRWIKFINSTAGNIQEALEDFSATLSKKDNVHDIKIEIEVLLMKSKKKILVIIDDVDRLLPDQITEIFQTISLVTNFSNIIYLVAFDRQIAIDAISRNYNLKGLEYLEKIIQIDYELPMVLDEKLIDIFNTNLKDIEKNFGIQYDSYVIKSLWDYHGLKDYFKSIRDFKRFFNSLLFRLPSIIDDVNLIDFLVVEAVRIFDYSSYKIFYNSYRINARKRKLPDTGLTDEQFSTLNITAREIIKSLSYKSSLHSYRPEANDKRLLDPAYFDRYFSLLKKGNDIGDKELKQLITRPNLRQDILRLAFQSDKIENLLKRLNDRSLQDRYDNYDYTLIEDLNLFFNSNPSFFENYSEKVSNMLINLICGSKNEGHLIAAFFKSFDVGKPSISLIHIYFFHFMRMFMKNGERFRNDYPSFDEYYKKHFTSINDRYAPYFEKASSIIVERKYTVSCPFTKYLYQINYAEIYPDRYSLFLQNLLNDEDYLIYLASTFLRMSDDKYVLQRYDWTFREILLPGNCFTQFCSQLKGLDITALDNKSKAIRDHILKFQKG